MFILFTFDQWYPQGGAHDSIGVYKTLDEAKAAYVGDREYAHIARVDDSALVIVANGYATINRTPLRIVWE